jgi:hypothetical protein
MTHPNLPRWVTRADGRLAPFDADRIHRALFAATENLGQPDPFLARELTDSVLHFLAEVDDDPIRTDQIVEQVAKVVRELGQPALAQAYHQLQTATAPPAEPAALTLEANPLRQQRALAAPALRAFSLASVYGPELAAAHGEGLLILTGLEHPGELSAEVVAPALASGQRWPDCLLEARVRVGHAVVIDGPEYHDAGEFARELAWGLTATDLHAVVNLNQATPPRWAEQAAEGPLFAGQARRPTRAELDAAADRLLDPLLKLGDVRVDWHLGERDFRADQADRLLAIACRAALGEPPAFVFDRGKGSPLLAEGVDRRHSALLLVAGLSLPALAARTGRDAELFLRKLGSLARLAISAAAQKRDFLRRARPALASGFLLERARLVVTPVGLESATRLFSGRDDNLTFAGQVVQELHDVLARECAGRQLESSLDSPLPGLLAGHEAGLTPWEASASPRPRLRTAGALHAIPRAGTARLRIAQALPAEEFADLLRYAWQQTQVARLVVERVEAAAERELVTM